MRSFLRPSIVLAALALLSGGPLRRSVAEGPTTAPTSPPSPHYRFGGSALAGPAAVDALQSAIAASGKVTFRSYDGRWIGDDTDSRLRFFPDHKFQLSTYDLTQTDYTGAYSLQNGLIVLAFDDYPFSWPPLALSRDATSLRLVPPSPAPPSPVPSDAAVARPSPSSPLPEADYHLAARGYFPFRSVAK